MASKNMSLKLLVHKVTQKVLYAEASKEFVDFLYHLFSLPLGTLIHLVGSNKMAAGCLGKLKESVDSLEPIYFQPGVNKDTIINSKISLKGNMDLLQYCVPTSAIDHNTNSIFMHQQQKQRSYMMGEVQAFGATPLVKQSGYNFVKEAVTYMVMDDLVVKPLSTFSSITFINSCGLNDLTQLEEKTLHFGEDEELKLLKASLSTNDVLTTLLHQTTQA